MAISPFYPARRLLFTALILQFGILALAALWRRWAGDPVLASDDFNGSAIAFVPDPALSPRFVDGELRFRSKDRHSPIRLSPRPDFEAGPLDVLRVRITFEGAPRTELRLSFKQTTDGPWIPLALPVEATPEPEWRTLRLGERPEWRGRIRALRLDPVSEPGLRVRVDQAELIRSPAPYAAAGRSPAAVGLLAAAETTGPLASLPWLLIAGILIAAPPVRFREAAAWLFLLALLPRALYALVPMLDSLLQSDPLSYRDLGLSIWRGETLRGDPVWGWGWQAVMALLAGPSGGEITPWARGTMAVLGAASCPAVYALARRAGGRQAAMTGAVLFAGADEPVRLTGLFFGETLFTLTTVLFLLAGFRAARRGAGRRDFAALVLSGAAMILVRSQALPLAAAWAVWMLFRRGGIGRAAWVLGAPALAAAVAAPLNFRETGRWIALQTGFGYNLAAGHNPAATGKWADIEVAWRKKAREGGPDPVELDRRYRNLALAHIAEDPARAIRRTAVKAGYFLNPFERRDWLYSPSFPVPLIPRPAVWFLFAAGLAAAFRRRPLASAWIAFHALITFLVVAVFYFGPRYLVPVFPCASFFAALAAAGSRIRRRFRAP